ncbi:MAG: cell wall hydrolase [Clostridia bacterium]|nr:cell wall hydrolase [Clostridia bacterium]
MRKIFKFRRISSILMLALFLLTQNAVFPLTAFAGENSHDKPENKGLHETDKYIENSVSTVDAVNALNETELYLLAQAINGEARGEPYEGKVAVGAVILNRVGDRDFPDTIAGVIREPGAFTAVIDGQLYLPVDQECVKAAREALEGQDPTGGALYYYNPAKATSWWIWTKPVSLRIGNHSFIY